ncbi:MAG: Do family serine endopeptidase [Alphaproteobacteria bacterium]|nr:Do family serine endopeptidase [Alphaproteobacteria bacterium]
MPQTVEPAVEPAAPKKPRGPLSARRLVLLGSVAVLGGGLFVASPNLPYAHLPALTASAQAQTAQTAMRPASFADIVEKVKPAVFAVRVKMEDAVAGSTFGEESPFPPGSPMERFFRRFGFGDGPDGNRPRGPRQRHFSMAQGSGFFISADGYAVTNNHVVERGQSVEIKSDDGKTYQAKVIGTDPRTDIALLKVEGRTDFPHVRFADKAPRIGDWVLAVGNPFGLGGTVTAGIVSASGRDIGAGPYDDFIQIDAPVNKGNSGGPTFDVDGNVIGVNTAIYSPSGGNVGIAFAIPADTVKTVVAQLKDKGSVTRGWIGVQIQPVTQEIADSLGLKEVRGALVADPQANGPAAKAGIKAGDVILAVNGQPVRDARDLAKKIGAIAPGETVKLGVFRQGAEISVSLTLGTMPSGRQASAEPAPRERGDAAGGGIPSLGLTLAPASSVAGGGSDGVVVTDVDSDGPAAERGFKTGDVILEVAGRPVSTPADVRKALEGVRGEGRRTVLLRVKTGDASRFVAIPVGKA